jgi:hypothetical protein
MHAPAFLLLRRDDRVALYELCLGWQELAIGQIDCRALWVHLWGEGIAQQ